MLGRGLAGITIPAIVYVMLGSILYTLRRYCVVVEGEKARNPGPGGKAGWTARSNKRQCNAKGGHQYEEHF